MPTKTKLQTATVFVLLQDGKILDRGATPSFLRFNRVSENKDFQVAVGTINEKGKREILGIVANAIPRPRQSSFRISSAVDNHNRLVGAALSFGELIRVRLRTYWLKGLFDDLPKLPQIVVVVGVE